MDFNTLKIANRVRTYSNVEAHKRLKQLRAIIDGAEFDSDDIIEMQLLVWRVVNQQGPEYLQYIRQFNDNT